MKNKIFQPIKYLSLCLLGVFAAALTCFPSKDERLVNEITMQTAKKLEKEKELYLIGTGGQMMDEIEMLNMGFQYFHEVSLNEARELVLYAANAYLDVINKNEKVRPYLKNYPFAAKNIEIDIWIRNPDNSDVSVGKIRYATLFKGGLECYTQEPPDVYKMPPPILKESYEEAVQIVKSTKSIEKIK